MIAGVFLALSIAASTLGAAPASCSSTIYPHYGTYVRSAALRGPGLLLAGSGVLGAPASVWMWLHDRLTGPASGRAGNLVVLQTFDEDVYSKPLYHEGRFASVQVVEIPSCASRAQVDAAAAAVDKADAVFFAGGDQAHYVAWKGSALMAAVKRVYARGGVVGGGSAGLAIQGAVIYDAVAADRLNADTHTPDAVADPLEPRISFTTGLFDWPPLAATIADTHFAIRDRFGRAAVFLARILHDGLVPGVHTVYALGVDQGSAVAVDPDGTATVYAGVGKGAYLIVATTAAKLAPQAPIRYTLSVSHIAGNGERFDLLHKRTSERWYAVTVDGAASPPYSRNPYDP